jgi:hypothetical protein
VLAAWRRQHKALRVPPDIEATSSLAAAGSATALVAQLWRT